MASPTWWTWIWVNSRNWWWTGKHGVLQSMRSLRVRHDWMTELNWTEEAKKQQELNSGFCWLCPVAQKVREETRRRKEFILVAWPQARKQDSQALSLSFFFFLEKTRRKDFPECRLPGSYVDIYIILPRDCMLVSNILPLKGADTTNPEKGNRKWWGKAE